jgi:hypothetical protein
MGRPEPAGSRHIIVMLCHSRYADMPTPRRSRSDSTEWARLDDPMIVVSSASRQEPSATGTAEMCDELVMGKAATVR